MTNAASILWPSACAPESVESPGDWTFYSQVSVSGPAVSTTVHRGRQVHGAIATIAREDAGVPALGDDRSSQVPRRGDDERQWGPWSLTQRELEVLQLLAEGATNSEISQRLYISPKTTKNHLAAIFQKLDVTNRTHALVRAVVMGLVTIE
jgi:DNA-binding NarL/FixJ family response regulator